MSSILILGDVHLGKSKNLGKSTIHSNCNSKIFDQKNILDWTLNEAEENFVSDIYLTGDVFEDPNPSYEIINIFIEWVKKVELSGINLHIILGNHDYKRIENSYYSPLDIIKSLDLNNVFVYYNQNTKLYDSGVGVTVLPFNDRKSLFKDSLAEAKEYVKNYLSFERSLIPNSYYSIAIGHFALDGALYVGDEIDDISNEIILPLDFFQDYDFTWMGHVHKFQVMRETPHISHIGSMDISDFGEADESKYIILFNLESKKFDKKLIPTRKLEKIKIVLEDDDIESKISNLDLKNKIISVEIEYKNGANNIGKSKIKTCS